MRQDKEVLQGWEFASRIMGSDVSAHMGMEYVNAVETAIKQLEDSINYHKYRNLGIKQLQGYLFEEWAAGTFNANAIAADSTYRAEVLHSTVKDSVDVLIKQDRKDVDSYSAKSYASGEKSAVEQAKLNPETGQASYKGQGRLVPTDQLSDAKAEAKRRALRNQDTRPEVSEAYSETRERLTDSIKTKDGIESKTTKRKDLEKIARESKNQDFSAKEHNVTAKNAIQTKYLLRKALKAGYTAAALTVAIELTPEIYKAIDYLIKNDEIDFQQIKRVGTKGISAGAEGFLRGVIASSLKIMCDAEKLGEKYKGLDPTILGIVVALVMQTVKDSILVAAGRMNVRQMGEAFVETVVVSEGYLVGAEIGGVLVKTLGIELSPLGYLLGSLIGTSFCVIYNIGKKKLISLCVDTGFTCFGLVEQDYELPEEVLNDIGVETIQVPRVHVDRIAIPRTYVEESMVDVVQYETVDINIVRRGVIGVSKIGFVL